MQDTPENIRLLNEKLGITDRENLFNSEGVKSINEMLESSKRDFELLCSSIASKKDEVEKAEAEAKERFENLSSGGGGRSVESLEATATAVEGFNSALSSMLSIVEKGNAIISGIYDAVVSTNIIDPDLLNSAAALIHSIRETNDNLIQFNLQKMTLEQQYRLSIEGERLKHRNRMELEFFKWQLRQEELKNKAKMKADEEAAKNAPAVQEGPSGGRVWSQAELAEALRGVYMDKGEKK